VTILNAHARSFKAVQTMLWLGFKSANKIHTQKWQGLEIKGQPAGQMLEILNAHIHVPRVPKTIEYLANDLAPLVNLPWAENHFAERVCGYPINPGVEWANWPDGASAARFLDGRGTFNHNYMERYWPKKTRFLIPSKTPEEWKREYDKFAGLDPSGDGDANTFGIRGEYGDLEDLVRLLWDEPDTRQAYLPIFFPEDTGKGDGGRKPCTLGYHFILREGRLHTYYPMRSCDFYRHWADDVYLTIRLSMWILDQLKDHPIWSGVEVGSFTMHCTSLHMFINDFHLMENQRA